MQTSQHAWAAGHDVALASLINVSNQLFQYNYRAMGGARRNIIITAPPVDAFPVRNILASGAERGDGMIRHEWFITLSTYAFEYIIDTYFSGGSSVSTAMTIYTRDYQQNTFKRYNAYMVLPSAIRGDIEYLRQNMMRIRIPFNRLVAL